MRFGNSGQFLAQSAQKCPQCPKMSKSAQNGQKVPRVDCLSVLARSGWGAVLTVFWSLKIVKKKAYLPTFFEVELAQILEDLLFLTAQFSFYFFWNLYRKISNLFYWVLFFICFVWNNNARHRYRWHWVFRTTLRKLVNSEVFGTEM